MAMPSVKNGLIPWDTRISTLQNIAIPAEQLHRILNRASAEIEDSRQFRGFDDGGNSIESALKMGFETRGDLGFRSGLGEEEACGGVLSCGVGERKEERGVEESVVCFVEGRTTFLSAGWGWVGECWRRSCLKMDNVNEISPETAQSAIPQTEQSAQMDEEEEPILGKMFATLDEAKM
ncbi:hypothetical protein Droror1_Dr00012231, partial [Drosera rotundifolia]